MSSPAGWRGTSRRRGSTRSAWPTARPGWRAFATSAPDVCVLDLMLPGIDGWRVIEQARAEGIGTPIVVVSARGTEHDRVHALEIGADDYLVKPFSLKELAARVQVARAPGREPRRAAHGATRS